MYDMEYSQEFCIKNVRCGKMYGGAILKSKLVEDLEGGIRQNVRRNLEIHNKLDLSILDRYAASVAFLRRKEKNVCFGTTRDFSKTARTDKG